MVCRPFVWSVICCVLVCCCLCGFASAQNRVRRDCSHWTASDWARLRNAITAMIDNDRYNTFVQIHATAMYNMHMQQSNTGMMRFVPWHRAFMLSFEDQLRSSDPNVTLCYWDFTVNRAVPSGFNNFLGAARMRRRPGSSMALPTEREIDEALGIDEYEDFVMRLETLHDRVHSWVGGEMAFIPTAPRDPVFWLLHTFVDYLWAVWQVRNPETPGPSRDSMSASSWTLNPFDQDIDEVLDIRDLGYTYDTFTTTSNPMSGKAMETLEGILDQVGKMEGMDNNM